jgi:signal peptidase I
VQWSQPQRGEVIVFRYPENPDVYYIKRLIGLPGDRVKTRNGRITVNDQVFTLKETESPIVDDSTLNFKYFIENNGAKDYTIRFLSDSSEEGETYQIPEGNYFFMGDNRDQSSDSRVWGFVKNDYIIGKASLIWLSCHNTLPTMSFVCDPSQIRFDRLFKWVQ